MAISDEFIPNELLKTKEYCLFLFKPGVNRNQPDAEKIQGEHIRYLLQLREEGKLLITCPITVESNLMGVGILNTQNIAEAKDILDQDPNVRAGRLVYEVHLCMGFPGDGLR